MTTITLTKTVTYSDGSFSPVTVEVESGSGCYVVMYLRHTVTVPWDTATDMEALAKLFEDSTVRYFIPIVELLGQAYRMKGIVA